LHGGHSTYRLFLAVGTMLESTTFNDHWKPLSDIGCTFERATDRLIGIDIPASADIHQAYSILAQGESDGVWDFEEGSVAPSAASTKP